MYVQSFNVVPSYTLQNMYKIISLFLIVTLQKNNNKTRISERKQKKCLHKNNNNHLNNEF